MQSLVHFADKNKVYKISYYRFLGSSKYFQVYKSDIRIVTLT